MSEPTAVETAKEKFVKRIDAVFFPERNLPDALLWYQGVLGFRLRWKTNGLRRSKSLRTLVSTLCKWPITSPIKIIVRLTSSLGTSTTPGDVLKQKVCR